MANQDITRPPVQFVPQRHRAEQSKAFAAGVEVFSQMEDRLEQVEAHLLETLKRCDALVIRNEFLEQQNAKLERLYQHHAMMRVQCAAGIKNILDLTNAIAIREQIDMEHSDALATSEERTSQGSITNGSGTTT